MDHGRRASLLRSRAQLCRQRASRDSRARGQRQDPRHLPDPHRAGVARGLDRDRLRARQGDQRAAHDAGRRPHVLLGSPARPSRARTRPTRTRSAPPGRDLHRDPDDRERRLPGCLPRAVHDRGRPGTADPPVATGGSRLGSRRDRLPAPERRLSRDPSARPGAEALLRLARRESLRSAPGDSPLPADDHELRGDRAGIPRLPGGPRATPFPAASVATQSWRAPTTPCGRSVAGPCSMRPRSASPWRSSL